MTEVIEFKRGPGGRPTRAEAERRHAALLETAMRLFLERGYEPVSIEEAIRQTIPWELENPPAIPPLAQFDYAAEDAAVAAHNG